MISGFVQMEWEVGGGSGVQSESEASLGCTSHALRKTTKALLFFQEVVPLVIWQNGHVYLGALVPFDSPQKITHNPLIIHASSPLQPPNITDAAVHSWASCSKTEAISWSPSDSSCLQWPYLPAPWWCEPLLESTLPTLYMAYNWNTLARTVCSLPYPYCS